MRTISTLMLAVSLSAAISLSTSAQQEVKSLIGVITQAPDSEATVGSQVTFAGLGAPDVTMVWPDGIGRSMKKIYESQDLIILQFIGAVGSTETVYLELRNKKFFVVSVGAMKVVIPGNSVTVSQYYGNLK